MLQPCPQGLYCSSKYILVDHPVSGTEHGTAAKGEHAVILLHLLIAGWSKDCLLDWGSFTWLAVPSMLMMCIEWWTFEIGSFLAGESKSSFFLYLNRSSSSHGSALVAAS